MGGKKGGGSSRTPVEAKETGRSFQIARILEVISEGEIYGLVDDMGSVFLDKTPLQNKNGSFNFKNVSVYANAGTQDQDVLEEFNSVEREVNVSTKVLKDKPIIKTVTDTNINRIRMTLGVERLQRTENNGDTNPTSVSMKVDIIKNNDVVLTKIHTFNGKYSNPYREMFDLQTPTPPFSIKVTRLEEDSNTNKLQNACFWASYTEIIDKEFAYPNTALVGIKIDSEYFNDIPTRNYEIYGLMVKVPANYDSFNHTYTSDFWNGEFKLAWTNNPAWVFYDLVTNTRYGMGKRLADFGIDKWQLYAIGRYCDELVPDGFGGTEPRMTCNIWITDQRKAYDLINDICSIFRAMPVWNGQALTAIQDRASDPVWTYNNANTMGGFTRQRSAKKARHNVIQVEYIDADDFYEKKIESVSDDLLVARYGQNVKKITAFGCTSRGQAYRTGRWILETEKLETETITFTVGQEGVMHLPYDVIEVADSQYAGTNIGGRILAVNGTNLTLDRSIDIDDNSYLSYVSAKGITENVKIISFDKTNNICVVGKNIDSLPELTVWALSTKTITTGLYRAISIKENDNADGKTYTITALQHVPEKEDIVINGTHFDPKPQTIYGDIIDAEINYNGRNLTVSGKVDGSYNVLSSKQTATYTVKLLKDGVLVYIEKGLQNPDIKIDDLENGTYEAEISSYNVDGQLLNSYVKSFTIDRPPLVTGISVSNGLSNAILTWDLTFDELTETEIWSSETDDITTAVLIERIKGMYYSHEIGASKVRYYWLRHKRGVNYGSFDQVQGRKAETGKNIDAELELLNKELGKNIVNEIIDTALPARKLGMTKYVENLDVNVYQGQNQVYDETTNKMYIWNGSKYITSEVELLASKIQGIIDPSQLASIPTTKLSGNLTDAQIQSISATKLTGNLTLNQIPSIPTTKLTGQVSANQIQANAIGTNHIATNAITAQQIAGGAITAQKLSVNSVGANAIQTGAITTDKLGANSVDAGKIKAGAINANHIQAGQISADKLAIGLGGNLLYNPIFSNLNATGVPDGWDYHNSGGTATISSNTDKNYGLRSYSLNNENCMKLYRTTVNATQYHELVQRVAVNRGQRYIASAFMGNHRSVKCELVVQFLTNNGTVISDVRKMTTANNNFQGLETAERVFIKFQVPSNCESIKFYMRQTGITTNNTNSAMFIARPMLEECTQHTQTPSIWQNSGVTSIHGGSIKTHTITAQQIEANTITANEIATGTIEAKNIKANTITGDKIIGNTITADKMKISSLSALSANLGSITGGSIKIGSLNGSFGTYFEVQTNGGFRLVSRDSSGGIEISSGARALSVWNGATEVVRVGKLK